MEGGTRETTVEDSEYICGGCVCECVCRNYQISAGAKIKGILDKWYTGLRHSGFFSKDSHRET